MASSPIMSSYMPQGTRLLQVNIILLILAFIVVLILKAREAMLAVVTGIILLALLIVNRYSLKKSAIIISFGLFMTGLLAICVKANVFMCGYSINIVPYWIPFEWSIVAIFVTLLLQYMKV